MKPVTVSRLRVLFILPLLGALAALPAQAEEQYWIYTVRPGDTIWDLTETHTTSVLHWKRIQRINNLPDEPALTVPPGTKLRFPISILKHQPAAAQIVELTGTATLTRATDNTQVSITSGMDVHSGDRIATASGSNLVLRFADGSELLVAADSELEMDSLSAYGATGMVDTRVRLKGGQVDTQVKPQRGPGSRYEIITPAAVAAVRGTDFRVSAERAQPIARSEVIGGKVEVSGSGKAQLVPAGFGVVAEAGVEPAPPRPLLPAPDLTAVQTLQQRLPLGFSWQALAGATQYRFQIAPDNRFRQLLADAVTPTMRAFWEDLPDGEYVLRVRGIDADGLEGFNASVPFRVDARPEPPLPIGLIDAKVVRTAHPEFGWTQPQDAQAYRLQVARDAGFTALQIDEQLTATRYTPAQPLAVGTYHWRLATLDANGEQGPFSDVQTFEYKSIPDSPALEAPAIGANELALRWVAGASGLRYQVQFAEDADFNSVLIDRTTEEPRLTIARPTSRTYYLRVRAIDATGYAGPYGQTQRIDVPPGSYWPLLIPLGMLLLI